MSDGCIAFTTDIRRAFANYKKKNPTNHWWGYIPVSTYTPRSLITSIRDNFVIKHSSCVTKRLNNSPLMSPRQITCKIFSYSNTVIVPKKVIGFLG